MIINILLISIFGHKSEGTLILVSKLLIQIIFQKLDNE